MMILDFDKLMYPQLKDRQRQPYDTSVSGTSVSGTSVYDLDRMRQAYRDTFLSDSGRVVLADIAQRGLLHTVSFTGAASGTDFNEGKRALALEILQLLNPNPIHNIIGDHDDGTSQFD
jgi:hypothetical protein